MDNGLKTLREQNAKKVSQMQAQISTSKDNYSKSIFTDHYEKFITLAIPKSEQLLLKEKEPIELSLKNNSFAIGVVPFEDIQSAKFLLENIHVLEALKASSS